ncbi:hypothetical protein TIFTF001_013873 [Ficus carica]|uniref:Uncharacterized protein n=1 Tax=Ficus carica TaxID=3494 RepID=A0AA88A537_FICCA|nr:hypothetical protein TIFTF001_013873 [Ficus carica]
MAMSLGKRKWEKQGLGSVGSSLNASKGWLDCSIGGLAKLVANYCSSFALVVCGVNGLVEYGEWSFS